MAQIGTYNGHPVYDEEGGPLDDEGFVFILYDNPPQDFIPTEWPASTGIEIGVTDTDETYPPTWAERPGVGKP
jgi:hypothetical protein